jgi:hypothetical protein
MNELILFEKCTFENMEYIFEVCYKDGIKVVNRSVKNYAASKNRLSSQLTGLKSIKKIKNLDDLEEYLKSFKGIPKHFMQDEAFSVVTNGPFKEIEITFSKPEVVDYNNIENHINRKNITDIRYFYHNNVYNVHYDENGIIEIIVSKANLSDICKEPYDIINVSGVYQNNKMEIKHITLRIENDGFIDIISGCTSDIIISYHIINKDDQHRLEEIINNGDKVESAICLRKYDGDIIIYEDNYNYKHFVNMEKATDLYVDDIDLADEIDESDPDYLFWKSIDNMMEK